MHTLKHASTLFGDSRVKRGEGEVEGGRGIYIYICVFTNSRMVKDGIPPSFYTRYN